MKMKRLAMAAALAGLAASSVATLGGCVIVVAKDKGTTSLIPGDQFLHSWLLELDADDLASHPSLRITNPAGDIVVKATQGPARIEVDTYSPDRHRARSMKLKPKKSDAATLALEPDWPGGIRNNESCDLIVYVPTRDGVEISVSAGDVEVGGMSGGLVAETAAGDVEVLSHDGPAALSTKAGDIEATDVAGPVEATGSAGDIDLHNVGWPIEARTSAGDIGVTMRYGFSGTLTASTSAGSIDLPGSATRSRSGSMTTATSMVGEGTPENECVFTTSAGDIEVRVLPATNE